MRRGSKILLACLATGASLAALHRAGLADAVFGRADQHRHPAPASAQITARPTAAHLAVTVAGIAPSYGLQATWNSPLNAWHLAAGDFDGNGRDDVAALAPNAGGVGSSLYLHLQGLAGSLGAPTLLPIPEGFDASKVRNVVPADLNEDGRTDLVLTHSLLPGIHYLLSNGLGGFDWRTDDYSNLVPGTGSVVGDIDGDGNLDVVASARLIKVLYGDVQRPDQRITYFGDGAGNFVRHRSESTGQIARDLALGDFNNDGAPDLALTGTGSDKAHHALVYLNDGAGQFLAPSTMDAKVSYVFAEAGDLTGDGLTDLVLRDSERLGLHRQLPGGSVDRYFSEFPTWSFSKDLRIVDLNGDGLKDVIYPWSFGPSVLYQLQDAYGLQHQVWNPFTISGTPTQYTANSLVTGDFNGDGVSDAVVATNKWGMVLLSGTLTAYTGSGTLPSAPTVGTPVMDPTVTSYPYLATVPVGPPVGDGGEPVTGYSVFSVPSGLLDLDAGTPVATHRLRQFLPNISYQVYARAHNAVGLGPPSALSSVAVSAGTPEALNALPRLSVVRDAVENEFDAGTSPLPFTVRLDRPAPPGGVHFDLATRDGTATAGSDYLAQVRPGMSIPEGLTRSETIVVEVVGDMVIEAEELFYVDLVNVQGAAATMFQGELPIYDNDEFLPRLAVGRLSVPEGNSGPTTVMVPILLSSPQPNTLTFDIEAWCYSCDGGDHQELKVNDIVIPAGTTSLEVPLVINGDTTFELDERVQLQVKDIALYVTEGSVTIVNDDPRPTLSVTDVTVVEGNQGDVELKFTTSLSAPMPVDVTYSAETVDGTGKEGSDYIGRYVGDLRIWARQAIQNHEIVIRGVGDTRFEGNETFLLRLKDADTAALGHGDGVGTLLDDDVPNGIAIDDSQVVEGNAGTRQLVFNIRLSEPSATPVTFDAFTSPGTAQPGADYTVQSGNGLSIPAGSTLASFSVPIVGDTAVEGHESFVVELANVVGATVSKRQGRGRIINDDLPTLSIGDASVVELDEGQSTFATFQLTLSDPSPVPVLFHASFGPGGTASPGHDHPYEVTPATIYFDAGRTTRTLDIRVFGNDVQEPDETFLIQLSDVSGAILGDGVGTGTIINDDGPTPPPTVTASASARKLQKRAPAELRRAPAKASRRER